MTSTQYFVIVNKCFKQKTLHETQFLHNYVYITIHYNEIFVTSKLAHQRKIGICIKPSPIPYVILSHLRGLVAHLTMKRA